MLTIITRSERLTSVINPGNIAVGAGSAAINALPDRTQDQREFAYRHIQNTGANPLNFAIGEDAGPDSFNGILNQYQIFVVPTTQRVSVYAGTATTVAICELVRNSGTMGIDDNYTNNPPAPFFPDKK